MTTRLLQEPGLPAAAEPADGGSRSRIHVRCAKSRSRLLAGWRTRRSAVATETGETASDRIRLRVSWTGVPCTGACWHTEEPKESDLCSRMMNQKTAQADHY